MNYLKISIFLISSILIFNCSIEENYTTIETEKPVINSNSLGSWISSIETDSRNNLWLGVEDPGTVYKSNNYNYKWLKTNLTNFSVRDIFISSKNNLYITNYYNFRLPDSSVICSKDGGDTWSPVLVNGSGIRTIAGADDGILIAGLNEYLYFSYDDGKNWDIHQLVGEDNIKVGVNNIAINDRNVWIESKGSINSKLIQYNFETMSYKYYGRLSHINKIIVHENGDVFIAHQAHDEASGSVSRILTEIDTLEWFPMPYNKWFQINVSDIDFYKNDIITATSEGIMYSDDKGETWSQILPDSSFTALEIDKNGIIYAGTINGYVVKIAEIEKLIGL